MKTKDGRRKITKRFENNTTDELCRAALTAYESSIQKFVFENMNYEIVGIRKKGNAYAISMLVGKHFKQDKQKFARLG